ncbi:MAG: Rieske 2Fe-2S domain-containing protein [Gammaproteobacteria bacterium]|nr:Rieske 2Fe-2S domain-containing protein [Gammaproteobacteria bacterium]
MSEALDYLQKARPEAIASYFDFLKKSSRHLDPRTRALISLITKVDNQTEKGFRQYLSRALQAGASPDEVLDALLTAFPTLGLSKIVWAVDLILEMDLPEFYPENLGHRPEWHEIIAVEQIEDEVCFVSTGQKDLFIYSDGVNFHIYDSLCPHQQTHIPESGLSGCVLTCPRHHWKFDLKTGKCIERGDRPLKELPGKVEDGVLLAEW